LGDEFTYGVLAHEFQHMIHWFHDRNENSWLNEGFSELADQINGYDPGGFDLYFSNDADIQLTDWPNDSNAALPHYGASFLFISYFMDRFGENVTRAVVAAQENGMESFDTVFKQMNLSDNLSGEILSADEVFRDWTLANYLQDSAIGDGRFAYYSYPNLPAFYETEYFNECSLDWQERSVSQYGTDYIKFNCPESFTLTFQGSTEVNLLPVDAYSGNYAFWSNKGDQSDMTLTHYFDLSNIFGDINLQYRVWYDLETDFDYLYLEVSEDGASWKIVTTPSCSIDDISGNSYGCGYNGNSGGWMLEEVDLSEYAGKKIWLRFEYITDAVANGEGFLLDDISIPQINYWTDFEIDKGGWEENGFVRVQNRIPQTYLLSMIIKSEQIEVRELTLNPDQSLTTFVNVPPGTKGVILVISGNTRFTRIPASYRFKIEQ